MWERAKQHDAVLVTRDEDFLELSAWLGSPPKVVWMSGGNRPNDQIARLLRHHAEAIRRFVRALSAEGISSARPTLLLTDGNVGPEPVLEQVRSPPRGLGTRSAAARVLLMHFGQLINNYLVGMEAKRHQVYPTLSGGEQQKVQLARVLAQVWSEDEPGGDRCLFLDEPVAGLDVHYQIHLLDVVRTLHSADGTVIATLHDRNSAFASAPTECPIHSEHGRSGASVCPQSRPQRRGRPRRRPCRNGLDLPLPSL